MNDQEDQSNFKGAAISDDKRKATLNFVGENGQPIEAEFDASALDVLIQELGTARAQLLDQVPWDVPTGEFTPCDAVDPRWWVSPNSEQTFPCLSLRHPGFGWLCFGIPRHEARNISMGLRKIPDVRNMRDTQPPNASSIEGGSVFLSSHGTGKYYLGEGESKIEAAVFEQIEWDSDRSAGIVAAAVLEQRLEEALESALRKDSSKAWGGLFGRSRPLDSFGPKISLARLMGLLSEQAFEDADIIRRVRNDFAHNLKLDSFAETSIRDRCKNLKLVEEYIGPPPTVEEFTSARWKPRSKHFSGRSDYQQILDDARSRYVMTVSIMSFALGQATQSANEERPII